MNRYILIPLFIGAIMISIFIMVAVTLSSVWIFIPGVVLTYSFYLSTIYNKAPAPDRILPLYLLALGIQFIHFTEEYLTDFVTEVPKLFGQEAYQTFKMALAAKR